MIIITILRTLGKMFIGAVIGGIVTGLAFSATAIWGFASLGYAFIGGLLIGGVIGAILGAFWNRKTRDIIIECTASVLQMFG